MDPSIRKNRLIEEAESFVISWGNTYRGKTLDDVPTSYLWFIAENFKGHPATLAEALACWREDNGIY